MAKKQQQEEETERKEEMNPTSLAKLLVKEFNKDGDTVAWNLATDEDNPTAVKEFISFGSTILNYAVANRRDGGAPVGKLTEIVGEEASGKSLLCAHLAAECQKKGGIVIYMDSENAANPQFLTQVGVNIKDLVYSQPATVEEAAEQIERTIALVRAKAKNRLVLIIWDSIANATTKAELEGNFDIKMDLQLEKSKLLSKMMRKLTEIWGKERICVVFTNQLKVKIGVMYGDPMTTPGGKAVPYIASVRLRLTKSAQLKSGKKNDEGDSGKEAGENDSVYGINTIAKVIKNRLGPPFRQCRFDITFSSGVDDEGSWFNVLHAKGEIEKASGWCYYSSFPSGKLSKKMVKDKNDPKKEIEVEYDRGLMFREAGWKELLKSNPEFKKLVLDDLERHLVVKYGEKPFDAVPDPESYLDAQSAMQAVGV